MRNKIAIVIATATLAFLSAFLIQYINNTNKILEYKIETHTNLLKKPEQFSSRLKIQLDSNKIENLSILRLLVYNASNRALENLNIYFELNSSNQYPIDIVDENFYGQDKTSEFIKKTKYEINEDDQSKLKIGYQIKVANRLGYIEPIFIAEYIFKNDEIPEIENLTFMNAGVIAKQFNLQKFLKKKELKTNLISIPIALIIVILLLFLATRLSKKKDYKKKLKLLEYLIVKMKSERKEDFEMLPNPIRTINFIEKERREYFDTKSPMWLNKLFYIDKTRYITEYDLNRLNSIYKNIPSDKL